MLPVERGGTASAVQEKPAAQRSILDLPFLVEDLPDDQKIPFHRIFEVLVSQAPLSYSSPEAREHIGTKFRVPEEYRDMRRAVRVTNKIIEEENLTNPLRSIRPLQITSGDQLQAIESANPKEDCSFCKWEKETPMDLFGRIETSRSITAANLFAYDGMHSLVIPKDIHHPLEITEEVFSDMIHTANNWFQEAFRYNPRARFPLLIFNCLPRGGSSIFHPHFQVMAAEDKPYRAVEGLRRNMADYQWFNQVPFMDDMAHSLRGLGLVHDIGSAHIIFNPVAIKEREVIIYSNDSSRLPNGDLSKAAFSIIDWWRSLGVTSFDMVLYMPPLDAGFGGEWHNFPPWMRMVDRGPEDQRTSDFGTMEVYASSVVASDPLEQAPSFAEYRREKLAA